jgi:hypothetical protein
LSRVLRAARLQPPLELVAAPVLTQQLRRGRRHPRRRLGPLLGPVRAPESHSSSSLAACVGLRGGGGGPLTRVLGAWTPAKANPGGEGSAGSCVVREEVRPRGHHGSTVSQHSLHFVLGSVRIDRTVS